MANRLLVLEGHQFSYQPKSRCRSAIASTLPSYHVYRMRKAIVNCDSGPRSLRSVTQDRLLLYALGVPGKDVPLCQRRKPEAIDKFVLKKRFSG